MHSTVHLDPSVNSNTDGNCVKSTTAARCSLDFRPRKVSLDKGIIIRNFMDVRPQQNREV